MRLGLSLILIALSTSSAAGQTEGAIEQLIRIAYQAVTVYRAGDRPKALALLATISLQDQKGAVAAIRARVERSAAGLPAKESSVPWPPALLRALGALEMEAALVAEAREGPDARRITEAHIAIAQSLFTLASRVAGEDDRVGVRWLLAIGLQRMAKSEFGAAAVLLIPACSQHGDYAPLLVACGSIEETYASMPADRRLPAEFDVSMMKKPGGPTVDSGRPLTGSFGLQRRDEHLDAARRYFEAAIRVDDRSNEAVLRLANVYDKRGDRRQAASLLAGLLDRDGLDERESYLARLFFSRIHDAENRLDEAAAALADAAVAQSVLIARAHNAARRGNARDAAAFADQATRSTVEDPWWSYRFGQYWLYERLFTQLREEARQ